MGVADSYRARRALRMGALAAAALVCACGSATGPTAAGNAELIERFDSLSKTSMAIHADQLRAMGAQLANGAPVGRGRVIVNGKASTFSMIAEFDVDDKAKTPFDSLLTIYAWTGDDADTIIEVDVAEFVSVELTHGDDWFTMDSVLASTSLTTSKPGSPCPTVDVTVPPNITVVKGDDCRRETVTFSASSSLSASPGLSLHLDLPAQPIAAIRQEFYDAVP